MWPSTVVTANNRHTNCTTLPPEFFFVGPASSFHHHPESTATASTINFDPHSITTSNAIGVGVGLHIPQLWQGHNPYLKKPLVLGDHTSDVLQTGDSGGGRGGGIGAAGATITCQDCGNQAKKDCSHRRCRTCCKSRGYDCTTHLKSTWVPAARRRERQMIAGNAGAGSSQSTSGSKRPKIGGASQTTTGSHTSTSNNTPPRSFETTSNHQDASFKDSLPGQVRAPAVFKCVRVTAVDDGEDEYAYQAVVRIGGHVFKGFLYDQGVEGRDALPNISELHLGGGGGNGGGWNGATSSPAPVLDRSDMYPAPGGGFGGSSYGNQL